MLFPAKSRLVQRKSKLKTGEKKHKSRLTPITAKSTKYKASKTKIQLHKMNQDQL